MLADAEGRLRLHHRSGGTADIALQGATTVSWIPAGTGEVLFVSRGADIPRNGPLRGGIPVVFPQFAELGPLPLHGFAHAQRWQGEAASASRATLRLVDSPGTRSIWPHEFDATLNVELDADRLLVELRITNPGEVPFRFCAALHTYLRIGAIEKALLHGLGGTRYQRRHSSLIEGSSNDALALRGQPLDRVYIAARAPLRLDDPVLARSVTISKTGFEDVVVWNPGPESDSACPFLQPEEYRSMLCVEAAQVAQPVELAPGRVWAGSQTLELSPLDPAGDADDRTGRDHP